MSLITYPFKRCGGSLNSTAEQVSANRWHNQVLLAAQEGVDVELISWLERACA